MLTLIKEKANQLKTNVYVLYLSYKDPRVPWYAKICIIIVISYILSPIDFIPDFIPLLGYIDDLIIVFLGIYLAYRMIPQHVLAEYQQQAISETLNLKSKWLAAVVIIFLWLTLLFLVIYYFLLSNTNN